VVIPVVIGLASAQPGLRTGRRGFFWKRQSVWKGA